MKISRLDDDVMTSMSEVTLISNCILSTPIQKHKTRRFCSSINITQPNASADINDVAISGALLTSCPDNLDNSFVGKGGINFPGRGQLYSLST